MNDLKSPRKSVDLNSKVADHIRVLPKSGIREFFDLVNTMDDVVSLGVGEPDFVTPWTIRESAIFSLEKGHTSYTSNLGLPALRKEVCNYVEKNYGVAYDYQSQCLITVGVSEALDLAIRALTNPGDEIIYTEPCYVSYRAEILMSLGTPVAIETVEADNFALNPEALRRVITSKSKVLLLNFPCNPTGATLSLPQMQEIAKIAIENDLIVITDEIYSELTYEGREKSIASLPGMAERTIFLHGFSKAFAMTGFRIGYACGPHEIIDAMMKIHQYTMLCASITAQEAALEALRHGIGEMEKMRESYYERRNMIVHGVRKIGLDCIMPKGSFYIFPKVSHLGKNSVTFAKELLNQEHVAVVPGPAFGACGEGFVRCSYATGAHDILRALERIERYVDKIRS